VSWLPLGPHRVWWVQRNDNEDGEYVVTARVPFEGCSVQPQPASEVYDSGQQNRQRVEITGPPGLGAARSRDSIAIDGWLIGAPGLIDLPLEGAPSTWSDPDTGAPLHAELVVVHVVG
jgi:hypothetical protein